MQEISIKDDLMLKQRGRAEIDFLRSILIGSANVRAEADQDIKAAAGSIEDLPEDLDQCHQQMEDRLTGSKAFRVKQLLSEWHSVNHGPIAVDAFEQIQPDLQPQLDRLTEGFTSIEADPNFTPPDYWAGVEFHRTSGSWDGHPYMGFIHGEIIHRRMVDGLYPVSIFQQRLDVAKLAPKQSYERILDMGCSTGHFTQALAEAYPDAEITGVDLSLKTLEHAQRMANSQNFSWRLLQRCAEDTGLENNHFDLVASYILLHEIPASAIKAVFAEAFRVMKPGGDLLMSDVGRYADMNKLERWRTDHGALYGGEPHWRSSASLDLAAVAREAGFVDVSAGGVDGKPYPYIVQGRKPE